MLATWNGTRVTGLAELNTAETAPTPVSTFPDHPIEGEHVSAIRRLAVVRPQVTVSDDRVQARVVDAPDAGTATVSAVNRSDAAVAVVLQVTVRGRKIRLPSYGSIPLPAGAAILLPIGYPVGAGARVRQAGCQLVDAQVSGGEIHLSVWSPAGGEVLLDLPGRSRPVRLVAGVGDVVLRARL